MNIDISYFHLDHKCNFHISFLKLDFLKQLLTEYIIEISELKSIEPDWIYSFNTTTDSSTLEYSLSELINTSRKYKIKNYTIHLPKKYITKEKEYQTEKYVEFCFNGISTFIKNNYDLDFGDKMSSLKEYAIGIIKNKMNGLTEEVGERMTDEEEENWNKKIKKYLTEYKNCS